MCSNIFDQKSNRDPKLASTLHQATNRWKWKNKNLNDKSKCENAKKSILTTLFSFHLLLIILKKIDIDQQYDIQLTLNVCTKTAKVKISGQHQKNAKLLKLTISMLSTFL